MYSHFTCTERALMFDHLAMWTGDVLEADTPVKY